MPNRDDLIKALGDLVDAVYQYSFIDDEWTYKQTKAAQQGRVAMEAAAQKIMLFSGKPASRAELDDIFDWETL